MRPFSLFLCSILSILALIPACAKPPACDCSKSLPAPTSSVPASEPPQPAAEPAATPGPETDESIEAIGSTRNARVAYPMSGDKVQLTFLAGQLSEAERAELAKVAPNVRILSGLTPAQALAHAGEAHGIDGQLATPELLARAPKLVWVQSMTAGVERYVSMKPLVDSERIVLTNMRAVHGPAIADHAMAMLLMLTRNLRVYTKVARAWERDPAGPAAIALQGRTMLVVGLGGIGSEIARRAHGFGMRVIATRRSDAPAPDYIERVGRPQDLMALLPEADVVAICVPLTPETQGLFGREAFAAMKKGSYLLNVARGQIVDTAAMLAALQSGHLAGAGLDVTDPEPLPGNHPLWKLDNVVITPHVSNRAELTDQRRWALLRENMRRFGAGEPLLNVVDKAAGY